MDKINNFIENLKQVNLCKIDWALLFDWEYITDPTPTKVFIYEQWIYIIVLINLMIAVICFTFIANVVFDCKPKYRFIRKISFLWFSDTLFLLLYNLLRSEGVSFLSMRLFLVLIVIAYFVILLYIPVYLILFLPKRLRRFEEAKLRDKYSKRK